MNGTISQEWWFILLGYIAFFIYSIAIMALGEVIEKKTRIDKIICRKMTHIISSLVWVICWFFFRCSIHWVITNGIGAIALAFLTFGKGLDAYERNDAKKSYGLFYFGIVTFFVALTTYLVYEIVGAEEGMQLYYAAGIAYFCLTLGDGFAPIIVRAFKRFNPMLMENRSLFGTLSVFVFSLLSTAVFSAVFDLDLSFNFILSIAALTCVVEFYGVKGLDNILIDLFVFGYCWLYYLGLVTPIFQIVVVLSPILASFAFLTKSLSFSGGVATLVIFYLIGYFSEGMYLPILFITLMFIVASASSVISKKVRKIKTKKKGGENGRTGSQVIAVGLVGTICLILHYFTKENIFCLLYYICIAEQLADSISSDIGCLTKGKNMDILRWKSLPKGISGGVSLLGTVLAFASSYLMLIIPFLSGGVKMSLVSYLVASLISFMGTLLDAVLGSLFQARYECSVCGEVTESEYHCGSSAVLVKGFKFVKNVTVNLVTSLGTFLLGLLLIFVR